MNDWGGIILQVHVLSDSPALPQQSPGEAMLVRTLLFMRGVASTFGPARCLELVFRAHTAWHCLSLVSYCFRESMKTFEQRKLVQHYTPMSLSINPVITVFPLLY